MINTYNESSLHKTLKKLYSLENSYQTEVKKDGFVFDIISDKNEIIEIQTQSIEKLIPKIEYAIKNNIKIKIIIPITTQKRIITKYENQIISNRISPKKENIYHLFEKIKGIHKYLLSKNLNLEILLIESTEYRLKTNIPVQSKNKKRRFKKDWIKTDKSLNKIIQTIQFNNKQDYLKLLPQNCPIEFSSKDIKNLFMQDKNIPKTILSKINIMLWVYNKANFLIHTSTNGRLKFYKINNNC